ncbi:hypothetical protein A4H97_11200 [Niastella yeongjuensis]|uniref:Uncharacterized protein n=1 Tax=Niastella yeongjuensis TaxID=354355 RepID=A0A1V9E9X6_9BACT|nr:putative glycoside hydrolase [Niastella yeongjuensis]OQP42725.1 hypothetical protein A4H97_11200 [Niastella yeongjuensis]SEO51457.1 hypothetical protein SAMN05660816_02907 [Niastella yeongjuensis]
MRPHVHISSCLMLLVSVAVNYPVPRHSCRGAAVYYQAPLQTDSIPGTLLPAVPLTGIALAQVFESGITDRQVYTQHAAKVYFVWGAKSPTLPTGVVASRYFPAFRNPDKTRTITWYQQQHPDWIIYKEDRVTPAYGFIYDYGGLTPLDITNPEVREYYFNEFIMPAVQQGYRMIALDNIDLSNGPKGVGHFLNGQWQQLYTGKKNDEAYYNNAIDWLRYVKVRLHAAGVTLVGNITFKSASSEVIQKAVDAVDMWLDETGFTHRGINVTGGDWLKKFHFLKRVLPYKLYVTINQLNGSPETASKEQTTWVLANYLLCRGPQSLLAMVSYHPTSSYKGFFYRAEMDLDPGQPLEEARSAGNGAWMRLYEKGLVLVNPSSTEKAQVALPAGAWQTLSGSTFEKGITLDPASGMILIKKPGQ